VPDSSGIAFARFPLYVFGDSIQYSGLPRGSTTISYSRNHLTPNAWQTSLQGSGMQYKPPGAGFNKFGPTSYLAWFYRQIPIGGYCAPD